ncbi:hypothetical protein T36_1761 [Helicobacter cinaedi]|uniref:hypothetical protein n=1 Tax=Helicobacter cinaedi TaxID=213 RepID=UPI001F1E5703|nr:hypothetical protein [Helicobacter cinaedi]BDB65285.1 hypothetical protein T36_1761 [Helicobacter cinaedi]
MKRKQKNQELTARQVMAFLASLECRDEFLIKKIKRTKEFKSFVYQKEVLDCIPQLPYFKCF